MPSSFCPITSIVFGRNRRMTLILPSAGVRLRGDSHEGSRLAEATCLTNAPVASPVANALSGSVAIGNILCATTRIFDATSSTFMPIRSGTAWSSAHTTGPIRAFTDGSAKGCTTEIGTARVAAPNCPASRPSVISTASRNNGASGDAPYETSRSTKSDANSLQP
jgi:hypothetical protein